MLSMIASWLVIPTQCFSRLTNASSSTSSDHCYAILGHDLMCSFYANYCNMRQHRKGMTSTNTSDGGLYLHCRDDSNFINSIDSHQMVKIYAHLKSIFNETFSSNLPVTWENILIQNHFVNGYMITRVQYIFPIGIDTLFSAAKNKKSFASIYFGTIYTSLVRSQYYFYWLYQKNSFNPIYEDAGIICLQTIPIWNWKYFIYPFTWKLFSTFWTVTNITFWFNMEYCRWYKKTWRIWWPN